MIQISCTTCSASAQAEPRTLLAVAEALVASGWQIDLQRVQPTLEFVRGRCATCRAPRPRQVAMVRQRTARPVVVEAAATGARQTPIRNWKPSDEPREDDGARFFGSGARS